jgi:hypothetical protein
LEALHVTVKALMEIGDLRVVTPLIALAHDAEYAEQSIHSLERLLETNARDFSEEDLHAIANLEGIKQQRYYADRRSNRSPGLLGGPSY